MVIKVPIEIVQTGTGLQASIKGLEEVERKAKSADAAAKGFGAGMHSSAQRAGAFADSVGRASTTLARSADSFGFAAGPLRALDDVMDVAELGFMGLNKGALTAAVGVRSFQLALLGPIAAAAAVGAAIGTLLNKFEFVRNAADALVGPLARFLGLAGQVDPKGLTAGLKEFRAEQNNINFERARKEMERLRAEGMKAGDIAKNIAKNFEGLLNPAQLAALGLSKERLKAEEKVLAAHRKQKEELAQIGMIFRNERGLVESFKAGISVTMKDLMMPGIATSISEGRRAGVTAQAPSIMGALMMPGMATSLNLSYSKTLELEQKSREMASAAGDKLISTLDTLANQLGNLSQSVGGFTGKVLGLLSALSSGAGGIFSGLQGWKQASEQKGPLGMLGKFSAGLGIVGSAIGAVGGLVGGIKSLFGGGKRQREEVNAMREEFISSAGGLEALKAKALEAGVSLDKLFAAKDSKKGLDAALKEITAGIEKFERKMAGLREARSAAESLMDRLAGGGFSEKLTEAVNVLVGKVQDALLQSGLGFMATGPLRESKEFGAAQGAAGDVAQLLAGMREGGIIDAGVMAAAGTAAGELQAQAVAAAEAAGLAPAEATKAGFAAISPLLREQLNASIASGVELDANTKALIEEAKKNGINIVADPMVESVAVQKEMLKELRGMNRTGGGSPDEEFAGGTRGLRLVKRDMLARIHEGEGMLVVPRDEMRNLSYRSFAVGTRDEDSPLLERHVTRAEVFASGSTTTGSELPDAGAASTSTTAITSAIRKAIASIKPTQVTNAPSVTIVDQSAVKTVEGQRAFGHFVVAEVERALDQNASGLEIKIARIARRAVGS